MDHTVRGCIQKFPNWPPGARTASGAALCHYIQLYRYFVSRCSKFCRHNPLSCFLTCDYSCCLFRYRINPETFGCTLVKSHVNLNTSHERLWCILNRYLNTGDILCSVNLESS
jgi:hypothetical protein